MGGMVGGMTAGRADGRMDSRDQDGVFEFQNNYYQRSWGNHPDNHTYDNNSQQSQNDGNDPKRGGDRNDSRYDTRYVEKDQYDDQNNPLTTIPLTNHYASNL
jgi:hypothetical protein